MFSPNKKTAKDLQSQALLHEQALLIDSLEKLLEQQSPLAPHMTSLNLPSRKSPDKKAYALDLLSQIKEKHQKAAQERLESKKPSFFNGYPNLPHTPEDQRKERQKSLKSQVKQDLEEQIRSKHFQVHSEKLEKIEAEKRKNLEMFERFEREKQEKNMKDFMQNKVLTESWHKASKTKWLKQEIEHFENFGVRSRSVLHKEEGFQGSFLTPVKSKKGSGGSLRELQRNPSRLAKEVRESRDMKGAEGKEKISYQAKIKKVMQEAKSSKNISNSLSPSHVSSKKYFELRHKLLKKH
jgi:hypothetical protein